MSSYRRILSIVEPGDAAAHALKRAALLARLCGASLAVASVIDHLPGGGDSIRDQVAQLTEATQRVERLAGKAGIRDAEVLISERDRKVLVGLVASWQPDLVVVAAGAPHGLAGWLEELQNLQGAERVDVLNVESERRPIGRRVVSALSGLF